MLNRFLSYVKIGSQSIEDLVDQNSFPMTDGQQAVHSVYEWCCVEELLDITTLCKGIVTEVVD